MIAVDTSALAAIALAEPERQAFSECIARQGAIIGAPTLLELSLVLTPRLRADASIFIDGLLAVPGIRAVAFDLVQFRLAAEAFSRFGKGRHAAGLNFGDCLSYAVAQAHGLPLLFKGNDFIHTDVKSAMP
ncbi:MAG: VapC toxin family PIN domain ribonuclease [Azorhizobium sp. 35-67-5]|nr:MAG: VapC toxin family PIN domain ribonuclease [Azorhizobium sp. 35-67-5]